MPVLGISGRASRNIHHCNFPLFLHVSIIFPLSSSLHKYNFYRMYMMNGTAGTSTDTTMGTTAVTIEYEYLLQATAEGQVESLSELAVQLREGQCRTIV
jgi:hypothetical protein